MNREQIKQLQNVNDGRYYDAIILQQAIECADTHEVEVCLKAQLGGRSSHASWMVVQDFIVRLTDEA